MKSSVYTLQTNGQVERFIQNLKNCIKQAFDNEDSIKEVIRIYYKAHRGVPHAMIKIAPYELMFRNIMRDHISSYYIGKFPISQFNCKSFSDRIKRRNEWIDQTVVVKKT